MRAVSPEPCTRCGARPRARANGGSRPTRDEHIPLCYPCRVGDFAADAVQRRRTRNKLGLALLACFANEGDARAFVATHAAKGAARGGRCP